MAVLPEISVTIRDAKPVADVIKTCIQLDTALTACGIPSGAEAAVDNWRKALKALAEFTDGDS